MDTPNQQELYHYGVLGMKWGVRRGKSSSAYSKGVNKLKRLDKKSYEYEQKSHKTAAKASKLNYKGSKRGDADLLEKSKKLDAKAKKLAYKSAKLSKKGRKFYKSMEKVFADVPTNSLNPSDVEYGKRYASRVLS